jgi:hypothetical protein
LYFADDAGVDGLEDHIGPGVVIGGELGTGVDPDGRPGLEQGYLSTAKQQEQ